MCTLNCSLTVQLVAIHSETARLSCVLTQIHVLFVTSQLEDKVATSMQSNYLGEY